MRAEHTGIDDITFSRLDTGEGATAMYIDHHHHKVHLSRQDIRINIDDLIVPAVRGGGDGRTLLTSASTPLIALYGCLRACSLGSKLERGGEGQKTRARTRKDAPVARTIPAVTAVCERTAAPTQLVVVPAVCRHSGKVKWHTGGE
jgi:hypothetical protein